LIALYENKCVNVTINTRVIQEVNGKNTKSARQVALSASLMPAKKNAKVVPMFGAKVAVKLAA
jgi:hypothetical protein